jgi:hypothetical protein
MGQKSVLEQAKELLKVAKDNPKAFEELSKVHAAAPAAKPAPAPKAPMNAAPKAPMAAPKMPMAAKPAAPMVKDDKPHPPQSPQASAHNVAEGDQSLHHALKILDTPEKQHKMLHHLRSIHEPSQQRSPENRVAGGMPPKAPVEKPMDKKEDVLAIAKELLKAAKADPTQFAELTKMSAVAGLSTSEKEPANKTSEIGLALAEKPAAGSAPQPIQPAKKCMKMSKAEIKNDMANGGWKPKHYKKGAC